MKKIVMGLALTVALVGCDVEQEAGEANVGEEAAAETEQAMEETGEAMERAGERVAMAFDDVDVDADGYINERDFESWWRDANPFEDWDVDADGTITEDEMSADFSAHFGEWDADTSGDLTEEEVRQGIFDLWDENDDNRLGQDEWNPEQLRTTA